MNLAEMDLLLGYTDNIVVMGDVTWITQKLLELRKLMGLEVNQQKKTSIWAYHEQMQIKQIWMDSLILEKVHQFINLKININRTNIMHEETKGRLTSVKKFYYSLLNLFKSNYLSH